jgi:hypothetical protein
LIGIVFLIGQYKFRLLESSLSESQKSYIKNENEEINKNSNQLNQILNLLFIPIGLGMIAWCLYKIWKKRKEKKMLKKIRKTNLKNLELGILKCLNNHDLSYKGFTAQKVCKLQRTKETRFVFCERCLLRYPFKKRFHHCRYNCLFSICKNCYRYYVGRKKEFEKKQKRNEILFKKKIVFRKRGRKIYRTHLNIRRSIQAKMCMKRLRIRNEMKEQYDGEYPTITVNPKKLTRGYTGLTGWETIKSSEESGSSLTKRCSSFGSSLYSDVSKKRGKLKIRNKRKTMKLKKRKSHFGNNHFNDNHRHTICVVNKDSMNQRSDMNIATDDEFGGSLEITDSGKSNFGNLGSNKVVPLGKFHKSNTALE